MILGKCTSRAKMNLMSSTLHRHQGLSTSSTIFPNNKPSNLLSYNNLFLQNTSICQETSQIQTAKVVAMLSSMIPSPDSFSILSLSLFHTTNSGSMPLIKEHLTNGMDRRGGAGMEKTPANPDAGKPNDNLSMNKSAFVSLPIYDLYHTSTVLSL